MKNDKLIMLMKERHLWMKEAVAVREGIVVYRTERGPIFCVFGTPGIWKKYIKGPHGSKLALLQCSHDLRKDTDEGRERMLRMLAETFGFKRPGFWLDKILVAAESLGA